MASVEHHGRLILSFCVSALEEALTRFGTPEIFNTDQGSNLHRNPLSQLRLSRRFDRQREHVTDAAFGLNHTSHAGISL